MEKDKIMRGTDKYWVCDKCRFLIKPGKGSRQAMFDHRKDCEPLAGFSLKQIEQKKVLINNGP